MTSHVSAVVSMFGSHTGLGSSIEDQVTSATVRHSRVVDANRKLAAVSTNARDVIVGAAFER